MMITRYDLAYYAAAPLAAPLIAWRWARRGKYARSGPGMFGRDLPRAGGNGSADENTDGGAGAFAGGSIWLHAVSVGEVAAAKAIEPGLRAAFPGLPLVVSATTETGFEAARRSIPSAEAHTFFPADLSWNVARFLDAYRPRVVVVMETEIWPNFITMSARRGAAVFLVNAKISDRSFPRYRMARRALAGVFGSLAGVAAQTDIDAARFRELGVPADRVRAVGNCKFDLRIDPLTPAEREAGRRELGLAPDARVVIAGSTHDGEEKLVLGAFKRVAARVPDAALVICPRHPERFNAVADLIRREGFGLRRASEMGTGNSNFKTKISNIKPDHDHDHDHDHEREHGRDHGAGIPRDGEPERERESQAPDVILLDRMGALARAYGLCEAAIVAGSFCPVGGHNLLEPAAHSVPVLYGPNMRSQREMARLFAMRSAGIQISGPDPERELADSLIGLLENPAARREAGQRARRALEENQGAAARAVEFIAAAVPAQALARSAISR